MKVVCVGAFVCVLMIFTPLAHAQVHSLPWDDSVYTSTSQGDLAAPIPFFNDYVFTYHSGWVSSAYNASAKFEMQMEYYHYQNIDDDDGPREWEHSERSLDFGSFGIDWISWSGYAAAQYDLDIVRD